MPFIPGESLKSALEKNGPLHVGDVVRILYDVVDALAYAHSQGVVHRDIKPANILRSGAHALVTDFGVAKALNAAMPTSAMTSTGMAIGTPAYMAPEQLAGDPSADHRIDIYAVGLLAYELLSGKSPFSGDTPAAVLGAVLMRDPKPLHEVRKNVPKRLSAIIMQCLSKVPGGRPPTAEALLAALDMIATASGEIRTREHRVPTVPGTAAVPIPVQEAAPEPVVEAAPVAKSNRGKYMLAGAAVLLLAALGTAAALSGRFTGNRTSSTSDISPNPTDFAEPATAAPAPAVAEAPVAPAAAPPVMTRLDSAAIEDAVRRQLAMAVATKPAGQRAINVDSLRRSVQRQVTDSVTRANAARAVVAAPAAAPVAAPVAPAPAPAPAAAPAPAGKRRLAIMDPRGGNKDQPGLTAFSRALVDAVRASLDQGDSFALVDQDSVREVVGRTGSRDETARILKPDVLVSPAYVGSGDTLSIMVTVWDLRRTSSYGIRVTSTKVVPSRPELYLGPIVQSVLKQLEDLPKETTIYRH
jgi:serine/threonine-protein kinase